MTTELTAEQEARIDALASEFFSVGVRQASEGLSVYADCYEQDPDVCMACGQLEDDHTERPWLYAHRYRVVVPKVTYRIMPSGFMVTV